MNIHPDIIAVLSGRGITPEELADIKERMLKTVTDREAQLTALNAQISTLSSQRDAIAAEIERANVTVSKLVAA